MLIEEMRKYQGRWRIGGIGFLYMDIIRMSFSLENILGDKPKRLEEQHDQDSIQRGRRMTYYAIYRLSIKHIKLFVSSMTERLMFNQKARPPPLFCAGSEAKNLSAASRAAASGLEEARTLNAFRRRTTGSYVSRKNGIPTRDATPHRTDSE
jgi:hypothetical protein